VIQWILPLLTLLVLGCGSPSRPPLVSPATAYDRVHDLAGCWEFRSKDDPYLPSRLLVRFDTTINQFSSQLLTLVVIDSSLSKRARLGGWGLTGDASKLVASWGEMGSQALICVYLFRVIRFAGALTEPQTLLCFVHRSLSWPRDQSVDQCRLLPNKRLKLAARVD